MTHLGEAYFDTIPLLLVGGNIANRPKHLDQIPQPRLVLLHRRRPLPRGVARLALLERHLSFRERIGAHLLKDEDEGSKDGERMGATFEVIGRGRCQGGKTSSVDVRPGI